METVEDLVQKEPVAKEIQERLDRLAQLTGGRIALVNARGQIILESEAPAWANLIKLGDQVEPKLTEEWIEIGRVLTSRPQPLFIESNLGLIAFWMPIKEPGQILGGLLGYGGFFDDRQGPGLQSQKEEDLYHLLDLAAAKVVWEDYQEAIKGMNFVRPQYLEEQAAFLASVIDVLMTENLIKNVQV